MTPASCRSVPREICFRDMARSSTAISLRAFTTTTSAERTPNVGIYGADISPQSLASSRAEFIKQAGVGKYITLEIGA